MNEEKGEIVGIPVYVLLDEGSVVIPPGECRFVTPQELPQEGNFFVVARNKLWCHKETKLVKGVVPVQEISFLSNADLSSRVQMNLPKIPGIIIARAHRFFREVFQKYHAESEVMLLHNLDTGEYDLWCPTQEVSHASVEYKTDHEMLNVKPGFKVVGTIHSHCNFGAFHSGTDTADEENRDGIHVTIGHVDAEHFSMVASLVVNGNRCSIPCENAITGIIGRNREKADEQLCVYVSSDNFFSVAKEEQAKLSPYFEQIEKEWHPKVSKKSWSNYFGMGMGRRKRWRNRNLLAD
jgi:PRTRC genetic system protein A